MKPTLKTTRGVIERAAAKAPFLGDKYLENLSPPAANLVRYGHQAGISLDYTGMGEMPRIRNAREDGGSSVSPPNASTRRVPEPLKPGLRAKINFIDYSGVPVDYIIGYEEPGPAINPPSANEIKQTGTQKILGPILSDIYRNPSHMVPYI